MICALVTGVQTCALPISQIAAIRPQYDAGIFGRNPVNRSATGPSMAEASPPMAPEWTVSRWINADGAPSLQSLRGRVVFLHAFQMLCPACVQHAVPQSLKVAAAFASTDLAVVGLPARKSTRLNSSNSC